MVRRYCSLIVISLFLPVLIFAAQTPQLPLPGTAIPQFVNPLPLLAVQGGKMNVVIGNQAVTIRMCEFKANIIPAAAILPPAPPYTGTWVWGYLPVPQINPPLASTTCADLINFYKTANGALDTYIGPVIVNQKSTGAPLSPTAITFVNNLGTTATTNVTFFKYSTDLTLHWADPTGTTMRSNCVGWKPDPVTGGFGHPCAQNYVGPIAAVPHLHGGEVPAELDGGPDAWYTSDGAYKGPRYYSASSLIGGTTLPNANTYIYPNMQEAAPIWFHDHTLGATRLNVYAGIAGGYYIYDPAQTLPASLGNLDGITRVIPLVLQDRMFDTTGQLFFPSDTAAGLMWAMNPDHPYWVPEFVGDTVVINGKAWPYLNVEAKKYRFLLLNGSNARTWELFLTNPKTKINGPSINVIGTDGGYLDSSVTIDPNAAKPAPQHLVIMPGERYEVVIDFSAQPVGTTLLLKNVGKTPFPAGATPTGGMGEVVQFRVTCTTNCPPAVTYNPVTTPAIRAAGQKIVRLVNAATGTLAPGVTINKTRLLTLNEVIGLPVNAIDPVTGMMTAYPGGPLEILVNNTKWSGESPTRTYNDFDPGATGTMGAMGKLLFSETPKEGDTELWEIVNLTADAHPIHLHLVQFQILNRQNFSLANYNKVYNAAFPLTPPALVPAYIPGFGPPLHYTTGNPAKLGGNPEINPFLTGAIRLPEKHEAGWKDTIVVPPGMVTRIVVRWAPTTVPVGATGTNLAFAFDPSGENGMWSYVWHCHIIDHEDNEMMRPDFVYSMVGAPRTLVKGVNY